MLKRINVVKTIVFPFIILIASLVMEISANATELYTGGQVMKNKTTGKCYYLLNNEKLSLDDAIVLVSGKNSIRAYYYNDGEKYVSDNNMIINQGDYTYLVSLKNGKFLTGLQTYDGNLYYLSKDNYSALKNQWKNVDKKTYYFGKKGYALTEKWKVKDDTKYYLNKNGYIAKNEYINIDGQNYWFNSKGKAMKCSSEWNPPDYGANVTLNDIIKNTGFKTMEIKDNVLTGTAIGADEDIIYIRCNIKDNKPYRFAISYSANYYFWSRVHSSILDSDWEIIDTSSDGMSATYKSTTSLGTKYVWYDYDSEIIHFSWYLNYN